MFWLFTFLIRFLFANLMEYGIHRWAEHGFLWNVAHKKHHDDPEKPTLFLHSWLAVVAVVALIFASAVLFSLWGFWSSLIFFSLYYVAVIEVAHHVMHRFHISKHHMRHHADLKDGNYNVWIPLFDWVFGTRIK
jgi:sterol desaturase/sphingolipid hydroxylase (fatty acid hydroxylase superfamily)